MGFKNNYTDQVTKGFSSFMRWQIERFRGGFPLPAKTPTPVVEPDLSLIRSNAIAGPAMQPMITWVGHATMLVQSNGLNVLTDPVFSKRASPVQFAGPKRAQEPGLRLDQLPRIDVVVISHNHYDHLDIDSVKSIAQLNGSATTFLVPLGLKDWFNRQGISQVKEMDWWQSTTIAGVEFTFTPVQHWTARSTGDRNATLWGGWAVLGPKLHWYFSGDTGYSKDFVDTKKYFANKQTSALGGGFDIALIAVGAYEPRWFMKEQHVNPAEAVQIHQDLGAKRSVGVHWGTFELTDEPLDQPPIDLDNARKATGISPDDFFLLAVGQSKKIASRNSQ